MFQPGKQQAVITKAPASAFVCVQPEPYLVGDASPRTRSSSKPPDDSCQAGDAIHLGSPGIFLCEPGCFYKRESLSPFGSLEPDHGASYRSLTQQV